MKIVVVGAGAMGSLFAGHLGLQSDNDVWVYDVWKEHVEAINEKGLLMAKDGTEHIARIKATSNPDEIGSCDLMIVLTKYIHTQKAMNDVRSIIGSETIILTLQNGIGNVDIIRNFTSEKNILFGLTTLPSELLGPGEIEVSGEGVTYAWSANEKYTEKMKEIEDCFTQSGLDFRMSEEIHEKIWSKLMVNCSIAVLCALNRCSVGEIIENESTKRMIKRITNEITEVAHSSGVMIDGEEAYENVLKVANEGYEHYPSIAVDIIKKRKTEIDCLNGAVIELGKKNNVEVSFNESVYGLIKIMESKFDN